MLTVFGDESTDEREQRVFAVAGIMATQEEWDLLTVDWNGRTGGNPFHAADCESDRGIYKGIPHEQNIKLYADLVKMLAKTNMLGYGVAIDLHGHREFFPDVVKNIPYQMCFEMVVIHFVERAYVHIPQQKVKFTFDLNSKNQSSCVILYEYMKKEPDWKFGSYLDEVSFASRDNVGIQAADIIARETMKHCDNFFLGPRKYRIRASMETLLATYRYQFSYFNREYFESYKRQFPLLEKKSDLKRGDYAKWLQKKKLKKDTAFNRNKFLLDWIESRGK